MNLRTVFAIPFISMLLVAPMVACQSAEPTEAPSLQGDQSELQIHRVTASDISALRSSERLVLSASGADEVLLFDPSQGAIDFWRIDLICPNGQRMGMDLWLDTLAKEQGVDLEQLTGDKFSLARSHEDAFEVIESKAGATTPTLQPQREPEDTYCCQESCYLCTDGQWICSCIQWCSGGPIP